ncbi:MAG: inorganic pyrophosphatase [Chloroflexi bacterium]|nr:inorganic pyrophosphatase [Chloroflexota bacterium]
MITAQNDNFWLKLDQLVAEHDQVVDRPKGSCHPRYPLFVYPLDYGYLEGTLAADGGGIDIWMGSMPNKTVTAVVCTVDMKKRDTEVKILLGCTPQEAREVLGVHNDKFGFQGAVLVERPST